MLGDALRAIINRIKTKRGSKKCNVKAIFRSPNSFNKAVEKKYTSNASVSIYFKFMLVYFLRKRKKEMLK